MNEEIEPAALLDLIQMYADLSATVPWLETEHSRTQYGVNTALAVLKKARNDTMLKIKSAILGGIEK